MSEYCEGEACGTMAGEASGGGGMLFLILMSSGVTCAAIIYDLVQRYLVQVPEGNKERKDGKKRTYSEVTTELTITLTKLEALEKEREQKVRVEHRELQRETEKLQQLTEKFTLAVEAPVKASSAHTQSFARRPRGNTGADDVFGDGADGAGTEASGTGKGEYGLRCLLGGLVDVIRSTVQLYPSRENVSEECQEKLDTIAQLEKPCNTLSGEFDKCAVLLSEVLKDEEDKAKAAGGEEGSNLAVCQSRLVAVRSQWGGIRRLLYCIDVHLKNASDYHQFYFELAELQNILDRFNGNMTDALSKDVVHAQNLQELKDFEDNAKLTMRNLRQWDATVGRLGEESKQVIPVHMRTSPIEEPLAATALCSYRRDELSVSEGDIITLDNNEDSYAWKVTTVSGVSGVLPAVTVLIPPPDQRAFKELSRLRQSLREAYVSVKIQFQRRLITVATDIISDILKNKRHCIAVIHPQNKVNMLAEIAAIQETFSLHYSNDEDWPQLEDHLEELRKAITEAKEEGEETECLKEVMEMLSTLTTITTSYQTLITTLDNHKTLNYSKSRDGTGSNGGEWDTLEDLEQAKRDMTLGVKVRKESTEIGEASTYESASGETRSTFSIKAVVDTRDFSEISMSDAIMKGIVDSNRGVYINPKTHEEIPIPTAMSQGFILVESTQTQKTRELKKAVGIVTVKVTHETRPYTVKAILDPRTDTELTISKAVEEGVYDSTRERWCNPDTGEEMSVENAIDCGGFLVDYDTDSPTAEPEVTEKTFAVFGVLDRKSGKRLPFHEASEKGLIDKAEGIYTDSMTGEQMHVVDAFKKNYVRGRVIEDPKQLDYYLNEHLNHSRSSSFSDA